MSLQDREIGTEAVVVTQRVYLQGAPSAGNLDEPLLDPVEVLGDSRVDARVAGFRTAAPE